MSTNSLTMPTLTATSRHVNRQSTITLEDQRGSVADVVVLNKPRIKVTTWRFLNTIFIFAVGSTKTILAYQGQTAAPNALDWGVGVVWALVSYWFSVLESEHPSIFPWLFEQDVDPRFAVGVILAPPAVFLLALYTWLVAALAGRICYAYPAEWFRPFAVLLATLAILLATVLGVLVMVGLLMLCAKIPTNLFYNLIRDYLALTSRAWSRTSTFMRILLAFLWTIMIVAALVLVQVWIPEVFPVNPKLDYPHMSFLIPVATSLGVSVVWATMAVYTIWGITFLAVQSFSKRNS